MTAPNEIRASYGPARPRGPAGDAAPRQAPNHGSPTPACCAPMTACLRAGQLPGGCPPARRAFYTGTDGEIYPVLPPLKDQEELDDRLVTAGMIATALLAFSITAGVGFLYQTVLF